MQWFASALESMAKRSCTAMDSGVWRPFGAFLPKQLAVRLHSSDFLRNARSSAVLSVVVARVHFLMLLLLSIPGAQDCTPGRTSAPEEWGFDCTATFDTPTKAAANAGSYKAVMARGRLFAELPNQVWQNRRS
jgi:hypothetical protein